MAAVPFLLLPALAAKNSRPVARMRSVRFIVTDISLRALRLAGELGFGAAVKRDVQGYEK